MIQRLLRTLIHLKPKQICYQLKNRIIKQSYKEHILDKTVQKIFFEQSIPKYVSVKGNNFTFVNLSTEFKSWNDTQFGMLWAYNLNYMDWLLQEDMSFEEGAKWIDKFVDEINSNKVGLDPYPIALRGINWIKFISKHNDLINDKQLSKWNNSLYSQYKLLERKLEYHLLGNHLLEDIYSIYIASIYFQDKKLFKKSFRLLLKELKEETLNDGAHYEQSPMYHCILLDRLLDCYNISIHNIFYDGQETINNSLKMYTEKMLGHLSAIVYKDKTIPLLNDSANGIAPTSSEIFSYSQHLKLEWDDIKLSDSGYRKLVNNYFESIIDVGNIKATYQPGHTHADTFNFELRVGGVPFIVDTGISTYEKNARRQYERSTAAHNTVSIMGEDSSEVWGGFRVGRRAKVTLLNDTNDSVTALHNGFGKLGTHTRTFTISDDCFEITDNVSTNNSAVSYLHLAPEVEIISYTNELVNTSIGDIFIENAENIEIVECAISNQFNVLIETKCIVLTFSDFIKLKIK